MSHPCLIKACPVMVVDGTDQPTCDWHWLPIPPEVRATYLHGTTYETWFAAYLTIITHATKENAA